MPANLYKRSGVWYFRQVVGGQLVRRSLQTGDRKLAETRAKKLGEDLNRRKWGDERHTWEEAAGRWLTEAGRSLRPATVTRYLDSFRACHAVLDGLHLDEIDKAVMRRIAGRAGVTNATHRRDLTAISAVLTAAVSWDWMEHNPARDFDRRQLRHRQPVMTLPDEHEIDQLVTALPPMLGRLVRVLVETGMRLEEGASLRWDQVDMRRRAIQLSQTKAGRPRAVPLSPLALSTISGTPRHVGCPFVFWHGQQAPDRYHGLSTQLLARKTKLGIAWRIHDLRHLFAVRWLRGGGSLYELQQILGHTSIRTTEIYLSHLTPTEVEAAKARA